jgi:DNA-directed RNA polymerase subunit beta'
VRDLFSNFFERPKSPRFFSGIRISLASAERIREWSHGEVKKPETINYRTFKPERDGLFCAKIFGPVKDFECNCGKYKRMKHRGIVCEKCGVEVIPSRVRRERLGHISLATPVAHIWFLKCLPSKIGTILDLTTRELEQVLYCESYIVLDPKETDLRLYQVLGEEQYQEAFEKWGDGAFVAAMGGEAVLEMLKVIDVHQLSEELRAGLKLTTSDTKRKKLSKRLKVVEAFRESRNRPEWMMLTMIPVLPPDLRPLVPLEGGRFATSDLNDLYRRVINRNNRLKRLKELNAPEIIIRNERRMLQEAVDALFDNGRRGKTITGPNKRPLKSLSDMLKGKQGRFRQNLLGKRVDYSGRSVIVVGPELKLHECGLPKQMAIELFKPFIYSKLEEKGIVNTIKAAKKKVEKESVEVWDILEEVITEHPIMLNRAPTLHRLGIQAFEPVLVEGKAIQLHPLVCQAYNADFDGDQMAVHVPLSVEAQMEARVLMMSTNNILSPAHGNPIINPTQDMVLGIYYLTVQRPFVRGEYEPGSEEKGDFGGIYGSPEEVRMAFDAGEVELHAGVKVRMDGRMIQTTVGRILLWEVVPKDLSFDLVNKVMGKEDLSTLIDETYRKCGNKTTVILADRVRTLGFRYATQSGMSICIDDIRIPVEKKGLIDAAQAEVDRYHLDYQENRITSGELYNKTVDTWSRITDKVMERMIAGLQYEEVTDEHSGETRRVRSLNPLWMMMNSGARGNKDQVKQLAGMRGLMAKPSGEIIQTPITANFREGLSVLQYFISTHGARKGLADTALKTANSGYLTRKLVDVAQDAVIAEFDCGTLEGIEVRKLVDETGKEQIPLRERVLGRTAAEDVYDPLTMRLIVPADHEIDEEAAKAIEESRDAVRLRSVLTCQTRRGLCGMCYGRDLARGHLVSVGEAVGVIAAQSIGEPGTQLTMRTFHIGGVASRDTAGQQQVRVTQRGLVRFDRMNLVHRTDGTTILMNRTSTIFVKEEDGHEHKYSVQQGAVLYVDEGQVVEAGKLLAEWDGYALPILTDVAGWVKFGDLEEAVTFEERKEAGERASKVVIESRDPTLRPRLSIKTSCPDELKHEGDPADGATTWGETSLRPDGQNVARFFLPVGAILQVEEGDHVDAGTVIAKIAREAAKTKDITGGLPRISELFEARKPKEPAVISEIDGFVRFRPDRRGKRVVEIEPQIGDTREVQIPRGKHIIVNDGQFVKAGEALMEGPQDPQDILRVRGERDLARYLRDEIQTVYRHQGVRINDKHIEVVIRQMLRRVQIKDPGDTTFLVDDRVEKWMFEERNAQVIAQGLQPASAEPLLLGITKASLANESFLAASSFQETTKVLTEAAIAGKTDDLQGLKENVIMGRLIPAGTGFSAYRRIDATADEPTTDMTDVVPAEAVDEELTVDAV